MDDDDCVKQTTAKYRSWPSPPYLAKQCQNRQMLGNDGQLYESRPDKNGVFRWRLVKKDATTPQPLPSTWEQICSWAVMHPPSGNGASTPALFKEMAGANVLLRDALQGTCSAFRPLTRNEKASGIFGSDDVAIQSVDVSFFKGLMPKSTADRLMQTIKDVRAFAVSLEGALVSGATYNEYISLQCSRAKSKDGTVRYVDGDSDLEPMLILLEFVREDPYAWLAAYKLAPNTIPEALTDMHRTQLVWLYMVGQPCDNRDLAAECLQILHPAPPASPTSISSSETRTPPMSPDAASSGKYYINSWVLVKQLRAPVDGVHLGEMVMKQPPNESEFIIKYSVNNDVELIQKMFKEDTKKGTVIHGRIYDTRSSDFIGLLEDP